MAVPDALSSLGEELRTLNSDLRLVMAAVSSNPGEGSVARVNSRKQEGKKGKTWDIDTMIQAVASSLKGMRHVLQAILHFTDSSGLTSDSSGSQRPPTSGFSVGQLLATLWNNIMQTKDRMDSFKTKLESKCSLVETKDEEIVMLRAVLAQQRGNCLGASVSMSHLMRGSSNTTLSQQKMAWGTNSSHTLSAQSSADSLPSSLSEVKEPASSKQEVSFADVSCQTVETVFGHCDVCSDTARSLADVQNTVVHLSQKYSLTSRLTSHKAKWLKAGVMSTAGMTKWTSSCVNDLETVDTFIHEALAREASVKMELQSKEETLNETLKQIGDLQLQIEQLESSMHQIRDNHHSQLLTIRQEFSGKEKELEVLNKTLEDQLKVIRANERTLEETLEERRASCHNLEVEVGMLKREVAVKDHLVEEKRLLAADLHRLRNDLSLTRMSLEKHVEELTHTKGQNLWFNQQLQASQVENTALIQQLTTLEEDCTTLQTKLSQSESNATNLSSQLIISQQEKDAACVQAERLNRRGHQLELEKKNLEQTMKRLKTETERLQVQVEEEKNKQRLLMDYPMGKGATDVHPERQIAANNVRILLLEEFNDDLRAQTAPQKLDGICEVETPITLWKQQSLSEVQLTGDRKSTEHEQAFGSTSPLDMASVDLSTKHPVTPVSIDSSNHNGHRVPSSHQWQSSNPSISLPHLPAGSGRNAASQIRSSNQQSPNRLQCHNSSISTAASDSRILRSGDALTLMRRARRVARIVASAGSQRRHQEINRKTATGGTE